MPDIREAARAACAVVGIVYKDVPADGRFYRTDVDGYGHGKGDGSIQLFPDGGGGQVYNWKNDGQKIFFADSQRKLSPAEEAAHRAKVEAVRRKREAGRIRRRAEAAKKAAAIWKAATPASPNHPYLSRKHVSPVATLREIDASAAKTILGYAPNSDGEALTGRLLVVPVKIGSNLSTVELIDEDGRKSAIFDGAKVGGYWAAQPLPGGDELKLLIGEGVATVLSAKEGSGQPVIAALSAGNLPAVAKSMRELYPAAVLVILADLVKATGEPNPKAIDAARSVGGLLAIPNFGTDRPEGATDFNDLHKLEGLGAVKAAIDGAGLLSVLSVPTPPHSGGWADPEPLPTLPDVDAINLNALPAVLKAYVHDIAERMQCPVDFPAVTCLTMAGAAIGRKVGIRPKRADDWTVIPNQWAMIVGKSGIMKSPAISDALSPLRQMQAEAFKTFEQEQGSYEVDAKIVRLKLDEAEKQARVMVKDGNTIGAANVITGAQNGVKEAPTVKRYIVNDSTVEALAETLEENPNGVAVDRDELSGWLRSLDKEGQQEARAFYLTAADGDKGFTTDRIGRGRGRYIPAVCVSIIGGIQPGVLAGYVRETQRGGSGDDGLLQRFGMMIYPDLSGKWRNVDRPPNREARHAVDELIARLCSLDPVAIGAVSDEYKPIPFLRFDHAAQGLFDEWREELENRIRQDDEHPAIISHLSKYRKLVPSLALINHLCEGGIGPVTEQALARALTMAVYLETHARRIYSYASRPDIEGAKTILSKLRGGKLPSVFKARDVYRSGWSGLTGTGEAGAALRLLVEYGYLREILDGDTGGRPSQTFEAHPSITGGV